MNKKLIAIIDDESDIRELLTVNLKKNGFDSVEFENSNGFYEYLENRDVSLIILDLMLPNEDGFEICKNLKKNQYTKKIPIIMLTAKVDETDKIIGLELGADDYITKPFSPKELIARVKAVLRRMDNNNEEEKVIKIGEDIIINTEMHEVYTKGEKTKLTATEYNILLILSKRKGWVFSRKKILDMLWGSEKYVTERTVDVHIKHLREKLKKAGKYIKNVHSVGYKVSE